MQASTTPNDTSVTSIDCHASLLLAWSRKCRSSYWFATFVVWLGLATDLLIYSMVIPVVPFQLGHLGCNDVSSLAGWLLFAYYGGLISAAIPVAVWSEKCDSRKLPLVLGVLVLIGSQIMFMEAPTYWLMVLARVLQGVGSSMTWGTGLALLCDKSPTELAGRQLGIAMSGASFGELLGLPLGGALYTRFGFRGPFIFGIIVAFLDLVFQFLTIEYKDSQKQPSSPDSLALERDMSDNDDAVQQNSIPFTQVLRLLFQSKRALTATCVLFFAGMAFSMQEPVISSHLNRVWGLNPSEVGLVLLAAAVPTLFASPLSGWLTDRQGPPLVIISALILSMPWYIVGTINGHMALFIVAYASAIFFTTAVWSPVSAELASVSRNVDGIGYAHVSGIFSLAYGAGATVGPVVGGQMYDNLSKGWVTISFFTVGALAIGIVVTVLYSGEKPLARRYYL